MSGRYEGRSCLVTGSTGMAASVARAFAREGGAVFVASRTAGHAEALADEIRAAGGRAGWCTAELSDEADVEAAFEAARGDLVRIDGVVSAAGISGRRFGDGPLHEATVEGWRAVVAANATSQFLVCRAAVRAMLDQEPDGRGQRGAIVTMSSTLATRPAPRFFATHAYAATKGAIEGLTRAAAAYYAPEGIRVNAVAPALVATPMSRRAQDDREIVAYLERRQPLARGPIAADDVTGTVLFLLSDDARMLTGQVIAVDGGWSVGEG